MSKEREAFEAWAKKEIPIATARNEREFNFAYKGWQAATAYYQPLFDAKDAEIAKLKSRTRHWRMVQEEDGSFTLTDLDADENATLKALLEQAREGLEGVIRVADRATVEFDNAKKSLAAINAAIGEK